MAVLFRAACPLSLTALVMAGLSAPGHATEGWSVERITAQVRWDIGAAMPDGPEDEPVIQQLRAYGHEDGTGEGVLVCLTLEFRTPEPGRTGAVLLYAKDARRRLVAAGLPFYHGLEWLRGQVPLADACEAAEARTHHLEAPLNSPDRTP